MVPSRYHEFNQHRRYRVPWLGINHRNERVLFGFQFFKVLYFTKVSSKGFFK